MKKTILKIAGALALPALLVGLVAFYPGDNAAAQVSDGLSKVQSANTGAGGDLDTIITNVINFALMAIAIVSVIMIIVGGFRYTTSNGDSNKVTAAKDTIMYAVIGLVVAMFAYAIVSFVVNKVSGN